MGAAAAVKLRYFVCLDVFCTALSCLFRLWTNHGSSAARHFQPMASRSGIGKNTPKIALHNLIFLSILQARLVDGKRTV